MTETVHRSEAGRGPLRAVTRHLDEPAPVEYLTRSGWQPVRAFAIRRVDDRYMVLIAVPAPGCPDSHVWVDRDRIRVDNPPGQP